MPEIASTLQRLWALKRGLVVVALLSLLCGLATVYKLSASPPFLSKRSLTIGVASAQILVDSERSAIANAARPIEPLAARTSVLATLAQSGDVAARIAAKAGIPRGNLVITVTGEQDTSAPDRGQAIIKELAANRVVLSSQSNLPILSISTQSSSAERAAMLARATTDAIRGYFDELQRSAGPMISADAVTLKTINVSRGGVVSSGSSYTKGSLVVLMVFIFGCVVLLFAAGLLAELRRRRGGANATSSHLPRPSARRAPEWDEDTPAELETVSVSRR